MPRRGRLIGWNLVVLGGAEWTSTTRTRLRCGESRLRARPRAKCRFPGSPKLRRAHVTALRIVDKSRYYAVAREFAAEISGSLDAEAGGTIAVMTGGGPGLMEARNPLA